MTVDEVARSAILAFAADDIARPEILALVFAYIAWSVGGLGLDITAALEDLAAQA